MTIHLKEATASQEVPLGHFVDDSDGVTAMTGLTIANTDIKVWKTGATTLANKNSGGATHISGGIYYCVLDATDTNTVGPLVLFVAVSGALAVRVECEVLPANVFDARYGADLLDVNVSQFGNSNGTFSGGRPEVNTSHAAGTAWNSGAIGASTLAADTLTAAKVASDVGTEIGTAVWATTTRALTVLDEDSTTLDLDATIRAAVGLASANLDTQLSTIDDFLDTEVAAIKAKTDNLPSDPADASDIAAAFGTVNGTLSTLGGYIDTEVAAIKAVTDKLDDTLEDDGGTYRFTANALEEAPSGGSAPSAADIADAVWEEALSDHSGTSGSTAEALNAAGAAGDPWTTVLPGAYGAGSAGKIIGDNINATISSRATQASVDTVDDFLDTEVAAIKAKTDNLPSDPADASDIAAGFSTVNGTLSTIAGYIDTEVGAIKTKTDQLTFTVTGQVDVNVTNWKGSTAPAMTGDAFARLGAPAGASVSADIAQVYGVVDTEVAAIKVKTDNLPSDPADASDIAAAFSTVNSTLSTIGGYIDTEVAAIKAKTDNLPSDPADASVVAGLIAAVETKIDTVDTVVDAIKVKTDNLPSDPADASVVAGLISAVETKVDTVDTVVDAIKLKTDNLPSDPADQSLVIAATDALATLIGDVPTNAELATALAGADDAVLSAIAGLSIPTAAQNADALLDRADGVESDRTVRQTMRIMLAALAGKASGMATTTATFRDTNDTVNRIVATVDADGNRSAVTLNAG